MDPNFNLMYSDEVGRQLELNEAKQDGKEEATKEIIKNLINLNYSTTDISKIVNLSIEEVEKIINEKI